MHNLSKLSTIAPHRFSAFLYIVQTSSMLFLPSQKKKEKEGGKKKVLGCPKFPGFSNVFLFAYK